MIRSKRFHFKASSTPRHGWESNSELYQLQALTAYVAVNPTLNIIRPRSSSIETVLIQKQKSSEHEGREAPMIKCASDLRQAGGFLHQFTMEKAS
jgi:hypothetical protein